MKLQPSTQDAYIFYEPQYFHFSETYRTWVKLFISDCYRLSSIEGFECTNARFWKNHPIRWIQLVGIILSITIKANFTQIEIDDGSGKCISLYVRGEVAQSIRADFESNSSSLDIGNLLKVKGELGHDYHNDLQVVVKKLEKLDDPALEFQAWRERLAYRQKVLDVPWKCQEQVVFASLPVDTEATRSDRALKLSRANRRAQAKEQEKRNAIIDLPSMSTSQHTQRNLKLVLLQYLAANNMQDFSVSDLRAQRELEEAVVCVAQKMLSTQRSIAGLAEPDEPDVISSSIKYRTINTCLASLVRDGSILPSANQMGYYIVVGRWNLGVLIQQIMYTTPINNESSAEVTVRDLWQAVREPGLGFESVSKQMVQNILSQLQSEAVSH